MCLPFPNHGVNQFNKVTAITHLHDVTAQARIELYDIALIDSGKGSILFLKEMDPHMAKQVEAIAEPSPAPARPLCDSFYLSVFEGEKCDDSVRLSIVE
jgi:hypothetical protein